MDYQILLNPSLPATERNLLRSACERLGPAHHTYFATSGSTGTPKMVALSQQALELSARAVNAELSATSQDVFFNPLPNFHVGGYALSLRAQLCGAQLVSYAERWNPEGFVAQARTHKASLTSLVPTQVFDLKNIKCPETLRAVVVGGGALSYEVYKEACAQGWPLLPTYGLTECASQVATGLAKPWIAGGPPWLKPLSHVQLSTNKEGLLCIQTPALLTGFVDVSTMKFIDPKKEGQYETADIALIEGNTLQIKGRKGDVVKIRGELVSLTKMDELLIKGCLSHQLPADSYALTACPHSRLDHELVLVTAHDEGHAEALRKYINTQCLPYERIERVAKVPLIPRTALGKLQRGLLASLVVCR